MDDLELRIKIAEFEGYTGIVACADGTIRGFTPKAPFPDLQYFSITPDYLNDLNAMHKVEKVLFAKADWLPCDYETQLSRMTSSWAWHATAKQRAEALRMIMGW